MTTTQRVFSTIVLGVLLGSATLSISGACVVGSAPGYIANRSTEATIDPANSGCNGNMGVRAYFAPGQEPQDITGLRYGFRIADNNQAGLDLKILFGFMRLYTPGEIDTYLLESNLYASGLLYDDPTCTTWPLLGMPVGSEGSLRLAVPDYVGLGKTGAKTFAPTVFPRQSYLIDGLPIAKTDAISQLNLNQTTVEVVITRGGLVSDDNGWKCAGPLDGDTYRRWDISAALGPMTYSIAVALPESNARYLTANELINFRTEFFLFSGLFKVYLWDFQLLRESTASWEPLTHWIIDDQCGDASAYGVRPMSFAGQNGMEISNGGPANFLQAGSIFDLAAGVFFDGFESGDLGNWSSGTGLSSLQNN